MLTLADLTSILNLVGLGGLAVFIWYTIKGLRERITNLTELAKEQQETLAAVRSRAEESDRLSKAYKEALLDFQEFGKKLDERRNELVKELEVANQRKDLELARLARLELEEIELKRKSLERLPDLERRLEGIVGDLERQLRILTPSISYRRFWSNRDLGQLSLFDDAKGWLITGGEARVGKTYLLASFLHDWLQQPGIEETGRKQDRAEGAFNTAEDTTKDGGSSKLQGEDEERASENEAKEIG
jgi:hypothetical protein